MEVNLQNFKLGGTTPFTFTLNIGSQYEDGNGTIYTLNNYIENKQSKEPIAIIFKTAIELHIIPVEDVLLFLVDKVRLKSE